MNYWPLPDQVAEIAKAPELIPVSDWVEKHRILPGGSAEAGPKRISRTPAIKIIYDWFENPCIREIVCQKPAQIGLTDAIVDLILWIADNDPAPTALFLADQDTARKLMKFRILPALKGMGKVKEIKGNKKQEATKFECALPNGFYLMVSWGSSVSQTASMSFKYVFCDEINKKGYDVSGDEGSSLGRIRERAETYADSKIILFSTPTIDTGRVTKELASCDCVYDYQAACINCGTLQTMKFSQVKWNGGRKATRDEIAESARYICEHCGYAMTTAEKNIAVERGQFIAREEVSTLVKAGLQLHRLCSLFDGGRLEVMIDRWIKAQEEGPGEIQNVINSVFGEPWVERISAPIEEAEKALHLCLSNYDKNTVPAETIALIAGIDVQNDGFWFRLRGFAADLTSWGIVEAFLPTWEALEAALYSEYSGRRVWRALIDTGGGKAEGAIISRTEETYEFIRRNQGRGVQLFGCKGSSRAMPTKIKIGQPIEKTPSGKPIPGGIRIIQVNTHALKDALWWRVEKTATGEPGSWYLHNSTPDYFFRHITAEEKRRIKNGAIEWHATSKDNHLLDCEVYILAAVDPEFWGGIRPLLVNQRRTSAQPAQQRQQPEPAQQSNPILSRRL